MAFVKVRITAEHSEEFVEAMFNPEEYTLSKDNNFPSQAVPGISSPLLQFVSGNLATLEMDLTFDTFLPVFSGQAHKQRDVREETEKLVNFMRIDPELHAPPVVVVSWASLEFRCVIARISQKFTMFLDDGTPVRATLSVTFNEYVDPEREANEIKRQTADYTKYHEVAEYETLASIAHRYYQDSRAWRAIAIANNLVNPRDLSVGQRLAIPALPFAHSDTGEVVQ